MSTSVKEIIQFASGLIDENNPTPPDEVTLRCSTSRAYYAALHAADLSLPPDLALDTAAKKGRSSHQAVIDAVVLWARAIRPGRTDAIFVARNLPKLRDARKRADYNIEDEYTVEEARTALKAAIQTVESAARAAQRAEEKQA
jgi:uncharacterized protein (UPF0332 family)